MKSNLTSRSVIGLVLCVIALPGCSPKQPPPMVIIEGTLKLNGQPLGLALIEFMPELKDFGAQMNSNAVTDANGKFRLMRGDQPGAVVASHRVVINEGPPPSGTRGQDAASQAMLTEYMSQLKNRPIPSRFGNYSATPLRVEVKEENRDLVIEMNRRHWVSLDSLPLY